METSNLKSNLDVTSQNYLPKDALKPLMNPEEELKKLINDLKG